MTRHNWNPFFHFPAISLLLTALLCIPAFLAARRIQVDTKTQVLLEGDQRNLSSYQKVKEILSGVDVVLVSMTLPEVFTAEGINTVRRVSNAFESQPGVVDVKSLTHSVKPVRRGLTFAMVPLVPPGPLTADKLNEFRTFCLTHPLVRNIMVSDDSKHTLLTITYRQEAITLEKSRQLRQQIDKILEPFIQEGIRFQVLGLPLIEGEVRTWLERDIYLFLPSCISLLALILWLTFRSWKIMLLLLSNQAAAIALFPGIINLTGHTLSIFTLLLFPLVAGVHLTLLIHFFTSYKKCSNEMVTGRETVQAAFDDVFKPSLFAAITSIIGLGSLCLSDIPHVRQFGFLGSLGVCLVFFLTFGPAVSALLLFRPRLLSYRSDPEEDRTGHRANDSRWVSAMIQIQGKRRPIILSSVFLIIAVGSYAATKLRTDIRAVEFLNPASPSRKAVEQLDLTYGGINVVQIEIDTGQANGINNLDFLEYVQKVHEYAEKQDGLSAAYSYSQLIAMMNQVWNGGDPAALQLPGNAAILNLFVLALKTQNLPFLTTLSDASFQTAYLIFRTSDMPADRYLDLVNKIVSFANAEKPPHATVSAAKGIHSILEADRRILRSQWNSIGLTIGTIWLTLAWLWRSPFLATCSVLTNLVPIAGIALVGAVMGIPLNSITIMTAAVSLGIVVDDSIHFITYWRELSNRGISTQKRLLRVMEVKGRAIILTSVIFIAIFSLFFISSFPPVIHFGLLSAVVFIIGLPSVLLFLPVMLDRRTASDDLDCSQPPGSP